MQKKLYDIFIIGGGINGAGIAADAAIRGLKVGICEKNDFASGTSSASSKLIHGGLRYLEQYDFNLVRHALKEREVLLKVAPHLIHPLKFIMPYIASMRPKWLIRIGLFLYDHLASHPDLPNAKKLIFDAASSSPLKDSFKEGFSYFDCKTDDARLVLANILQAQKFGGDIFNYTQLVSAKFIDNLWQLEFQNTLNHAKIFVIAKCLVNAAGANIKEIDAISDPHNSSLNVELVKGSHIVVPKLYPEETAYILQNEDGRIVFVIPYQQDFSLIGTTDVKTTLTAPLKISEEEMHYLCDTVNLYFKKNIHATDVVWDYAGVRTLQTSHTDNPSKVSRDYKFTMDKQRHLATVVSGKLTTYRLSLIHI